ncbi:hypothetical protein [Neobacillus dielmonensis]|uniref:hypothetical protein n=1 Tax=Neobacillus dielmonensis TaxID=1347369 RepID=UPI0005A6D981|nr:hypothetical protein [Neobacillus dielmonensis]
MTLRIIRWIQRLIGILMIIYGIYLIFGTQQFFGALLIILALLIIPNLSDKKRETHQSKTSVSEGAKEEKRTSKSSE